MYPSKVLVNIKKIADNCKFVTSKMIKDFKYRIAVVKGNAYGHGVENVVPVAIKNGFNLLAVARVSESVEVYNVLKKLKKEKEIKIIILSIIDDIDIPLCIKYGFIVPISNLEQVKHYAKLNVKGLNIQWKLNTGMNRIGFKDGEELLSAYKILDKKQVKHVGIFSHIYNNSVISDVKKQFVKFEKLLQFIPNWENIPLRHIRASGGCKLAYSGEIKKYSWETAARPGQLVYGIPSDPFNAIQLVSVVVQLNTLKKGDTVGYEATYTAKGDETIAVIACGWADGFQRIFSKGSIYINNKLYPIVGKISMDSLTVKVDKNVKVGDKAVLIRDLNHAVSMLEDKTDVANVVAALCGITARVKIVAVNK